jgi:hypothetical protein
LLSIHSSSDVDSDRSYKTLADHVAAYFEKRFNSKTIAIEMGYNLRDACLRYHNSEEINLFWGIITGQIEEMVYHYRMRSIGQLLQHLIRMKTFFSRQQESSSSPKARKAIVSEPNSPLSIMPNHRLSSLSLFSMKRYGESPGSNGFIKSMVEDTETPTDRLAVEIVFIFLPTDYDREY